MNYMYKKIIGLSGRKRGKQDYLLSNGSLVKYSEFISELEYILYQKVWSLVNDYVSEKVKYKIQKIDDIGNIIAHINKRINEIEQLFKIDNERIVSRFSVWGHFFIIILLFLMDGIITKSVLEKIFDNVGGMDIIIILIVFFVVVMAMLINKIGELYKTKSKIRLPLTIFVFMIFLFLSLFRVYGLGETGDLKNEQVDLVSFQDILLGLLFFLIYVVTAFVGGYFGYDDSYKDLRVFRALESEYWKRKKVVKKINYYLNVYSIMRLSYNTGWNEQKYRVEKDILTSQIND